MSRIRTGLVPGLLLALALAAAGCGGGGGRSNGVASLGDRATATTSAGGSQERRVAFAGCMRQHGVNPPDPHPNRTDWGPEPEGPKPAGWDAAWQACRQLLPASDLPNNAPPSPPGTGTAARVRGLHARPRHRYVRPDPTTGGMTIGGRLEHVTRAQLLDDPGFKAAEAACRDKLPAREKQQKK
jgi:hypothetical protein